MSSYRYKMRSFNIHTKTNKKGRQETETRKRCENLFDLVKSILIREAIHIPN